MSASRRPLDDLLLYRLSRLLAVAGGLVIRLCEGHFGITRREWRLIATLASHGELGSSQLADHAHLDRTRTSKAIGSLVSKGLVSRTVRAGDRRQVRVALTEPAGEASDLLNTPLAWFADEVAAGRQSALLDRTFALTELVEAHRYMEANAATGKVVVLVGED